MVPARRSSRGWHWATAVAAVVLIAAGILWWNSDNQKDRRVWNRFRAQLTETNVTRIELVGTGGGNVTVPAKERGGLLAELRAAKFKESNRRGFGPTADGVLILTFADGTTARVGIWGGTTFEVNPRRFDPKAQFLITSDTLGIWLMNHLKGPAIGKAPAGLTASGALFSPSYSAGC